jgi:hypothetical protein
MIHYAVTLCPLHEDTILIYHYCSVISFSSTVTFETNRLCKDTERDLVRAASAHFSACIATTFRVCYNCNICSFVNVESSHYCRASCYLLFK